LRRGGAVGGEEHLQQRVDLGGADRSGREQVSVVQGTAQDLGGEGQVRVRDEFSRVLGAGDAVESALFDGGKEALVEFVA
jgi:hypothetical protein